MHVQDLFRNTLSAGRKPKIVFDLLQRRKDNLCDAITEEQNRERERESETL